MHLLLKHVEDYVPQVMIRLNDGTERAMSPRVLLRHLDYGYAGTTHKVQG